MPPPSPKKAQFPFKYDPLKFPEPEVWLPKGSRVVFEWTSYGPSKYPDLSDGLRGTVLDDTPRSIVTGVHVAWDNGEETTVSCFEVRELDPLERLSEV